MSERLDGQVAMITGGASGLGEATVRCFVEAGARVLIADVQEARGQALASELGEAAVFVETDVTREAAIAEAVDRAVGEWGRLDVMFANAGVVGAVGPIDETPAEEYDATMAILLRGAFLCMKHAARVMKPQASGTILCTSSIAGLQGGLGPHVYAAAKAGLIGLTRNVAAELAYYRIRVNCIVPGNMATPMVADVAIGDPTNVEKTTEALASASPLKGRAGVASDIAKAALWLASDDAGYVNGHVLVVDGGLTAGVSAQPPAFRQKGDFIGEAGRRGL